MKTKSLLSLSTSTTVVFSIALGTGESALASKANFHCQLNQGTPTTLIKTNNGLEKSVLHWHLDTVNTLASPEQLCDSVTQKLNSYLREGNDLSSLTFRASIAFDDKDSTSLPAICIAGEERPCKLLLFTLEPEPSENPQVAASNALNSILDKDLQASPVKSPTRGVQQTAYKVNFWQLLGF
ncbi:MAG: COP23 domain-containing protein [Pleurocapsa sp. MO_226.B13]|nr:COP23 domain-containing protein [Pleurocapsa sp. MO_226.B13]